jgi:small subunit ribosomal protein S17
MKMNDIGIDAKKPEKACNSRLCPWHGHLKLRGHIFKGVVVSDRALSTAIVQWNYYHHVPKYERYERRKTRIATHNPPCINAKVGDTVRIMECRPISKTKKFVIIEKLD